MSDNKILTEMELPLLEVIKIIVDIFWASSWPQYELTSLSNSTIAPALSTGSVCAVLSCFSRVWLFATLWTVAHQAPLSMGFFRQILEWVAISFSRDSSQPMDWTCISCIGRQILYPLSHLGSFLWIHNLNTKLNIKMYIQYCMNIQFLH